MGPLTEIACDSWHASFSPSQRDHAIMALEQGQIVLLKQLGFPLLAHENTFLSPHYSDPKSKNISLDPKGHRLSGAIGSDQEYNQIKTLMQRYAEQTTHFIKQLFPSYSTSLLNGRTSFRPVEIEGRKAPSYRKDDTRLHVDAFPSAPNQGRRILRVFTNIHPQNRPRIWRVGEPFETVAKQFLPLVKKNWPLKSSLLQLFRITKSFRTNYDHIMLQIHDAMKWDRRYQQEAPQTTVSFAPGTSWIVQTDHVSHAAMSGQYVLEQTFYLPVHAMREPQLSPLRTLERLIGNPLV